MWNNSVYNVYYIIIFDKTIVEKRFVVLRFSTDKPKKKKYQAFNWIVII